MKVGKFYVSLIILVLAAFILQACGPAASPATTESDSAMSVETQAPDAEPEEAPAPEERTKLTIGALPFLAFAPFFIAIEEGYFSEQGLDVEVSPLTQQQELLPALASGDLDATSAMLGAGMFNTIDRSGTIKIVAGVNYIDPGYECSTFATIGAGSMAAEGDLNDPAYLRGKTVDIVETTWMEYYFEKELETLGMSLDEFAIVDFPTPAQPEAMTQGTLHISTQSEPWITRMVDAGHQSFLAPVGDILPDSQVTALLIGSSLQGEVGERFVAAYLQAARQYMEGKTERNIEILSKHTQLEPELLARLCWPTISVNGDLNLESMREFQDWAQAKGYVGKILEPEQFFASQYLEAALEIAGAAKP